MNWIKKFSVVMFVTFLSFKSLSFLAIKLDYFKQTSPLLFIKEQLPVTIKTSLMEGLKVINGLLDIPLTVFFDMEKAANNINTNTIN